MVDTPKTLQEAIQFYSDRAVCQDVLVAARWPNGVCCPQCGSLEVGYLKNQRRWQCREKHSRRQFSVKVGTIFEDSPLGLDKWFMALWLLASAKNGISSYELHRAIGVTQKTAWFILHRLRLVMQAGSFEKMDGTVEVDEMLVGGKARNMHAKRKRRALAIGKVPVMGLLERHGPKGHSRVKTAIVPNTRKYRLHAEVHDAVRHGATVYSDELKSYDDLDATYIRDVINHAETYVRGSVHTNGMENFWSLLKRTLKGTYVRRRTISLVSLPRRAGLPFNSRKATDGNRFQDLLNRLVGRRLTYDHLTGKRGYTPA